MSQGVVISQPGKGEKGFEMVVAPPPQVSMFAGCPPEMAYLANLSEVRIHQIIELIEVLCNWEKNNKYRVCNSNEQQFLFVKEETDCCTRQFCGTGRPFEMFFYDNNQTRQLMRMYRPLRCQGSCFWCCCLQTMDIECPPGNMIAKIDEVWTCIQPKYNISAADGSPLFYIEGDTCYCKCCTDVEFRIYLGTSSAPGEMIGKIIKHWSGCREVCGGANDFTVQFPGDMNLFHKVILLGAVYLIDFNYFEINRN